MKIFDLDGPFQKYGSLAFDLLVVNSLWLLISIFSFGILQGTALTGLYAGTYAGVVTGEGYTFKEFFRAAKSRFLASLGIWLLSAILFAILIIDIYFTLIGVLPGIFSIFLPVFLFMAVELLFVVTFAYPLLANSNLGFKDIIKYSFILANKHLGSTILAAVPNLAMSIVIILTFIGYVEFFVFLFFGMAIVGCANSFIITKKIIKEYDFYVSPSGR